MVEILSSHPTEPSEGDEEAKGVPFSGLTYGHTVLTSVVFERYDIALNHLDEILKIEKKYPKFGNSAGRYVKHAKSLVRALKSKREIGKLPQISKSKQQELLIMLGKHFEDLKACVINIEKVERQVRREDLSSTKYFVVASYWSFFLVVLGGFVLFALPTYAYSIHQWITEVVASSVIWAVSWIWPV